MAMHICIYCKEEFLSSSSLVKFISKKKLVNVLK